MRSVSSYAKGERGRRRTPPERDNGHGVGRSHVQEPSPPTACFARKPRDIFPLPLLSNSENVRPEGCRKTIRKHLVSQHVRREVNHTLRALNSMYGCPDSGSTLISLEEELFGHGAAQLKAVSHVVQCVHDVGGPPEGLSCSGAFDMLRAAEGYSQDPAVGALCSFNLERVSLPEAGWEAIPLADLWGPDGREFVEDFVASQLLPPHEVEKRLKATGVQRPYSDPLLNVRSNYVMFLEKLFHSNLIEFSYEEPLENIAIFFVTKKNDRQRMIIDARRANCHFADPAYVNLCTGDTLSRLECGVGDTLTIGMADLKDAFYHLELPLQLRGYFCLPRISTRHLPFLEQLSGKSGRKFVIPRLRVVPMGWSWALYMCQKIHERLVLKSGLSDDTRLQDRTPVVQSSCLHLQYVDNLVVLGANAGAVTDGFNSAVKTLRDVGLQVHEVEIGEKGAQVLGWDLSSEATMRPSRKRFWRVRMCIRGLIKRGRASSKQIEKLLGHCCFISLARRESLSIFGQAYNFVRRYAQNGEEHPLWPSVRKEFDVWDGILPLIYRDFRACWNEKVHAVDASEWGLGCVVGEMSIEEVKGLGRVCERWRFKDPVLSKARRSVGSEPPDHDPSGFPQHGVEGIFHDQPISTADFASVPFEAVTRDWRTVGRHRWRKQSSMPVNEARATLYAVKHILRSCDNHGMRHLIFSDSMSATCAFSRGRARTFGLRKVCQQVGALCLCTGSSISVRWVPSEWNAADSPSRGGWAPSIP